MSLALGAAFGAAAEHSAKTAPPTSRMAGVRVGRRSGKGSRSRRGGGESPQATHERIMAQHNAKKAKREQEKAKKEWDRMTPEQQRAKVEADTFNYDNTTGLDPKGKLELLKRHDGIQSGRNSEARAARKERRDIGANDRARDKHEMDAETNRIVQEKRRFELGLARELAGAKTKAEQANAVAKAQRWELDSQRMGVDFAESGNVDRSLTVMSEMYGIEGTFDTAERVGVQDNRPVWAYHDVETDTTVRFVGSPIKGGKKGGSDSTGLSEILSGAGQAGVAPERISTGVVPRQTGATTAPKPSPPTAAPPEGAVAMLKKDPRLAAQFDLKYGPGTAAGILGQ